MPENIETNNEIDAASIEQQAFEDTIRHFSDAGERDKLHNFETTQGRGVTFALPDGSLVFVGDAVLDAENEGNTSFTIGVKKRAKDGSTQTAMREVSMLTSLTSVEKKDGFYHRTVFDLTSLKDATDLPETAQWLVDAVGSYKLTVDQAAPNAVACLVDEHQTIGFDAQNIQLLSEQYSQGIEHNKIKNLEVATEEVDRRLASMFSVMGIRNRLLRQSAKIAEQNGDHAKANRLKVLMEAGRQNKIAKYLEWINKIDAVPAIPNIRRFRRQ